jgi:hypothetical protein
MALGRTARIPEVIHVAGDGRLSVGRPSADGHRRRGPLRLPTPSRFRSGGDGARQVLTATIGNLAVGTLFV